MNALTIQLPDEGEGYILVMEWDCTDTGGTARSVELAFDDDDLLQKIREWLYIEPMDSPE